MQCLRTGKTDLLREYSDKMFYGLEMKHFKCASFPI